MTLSREEFHHLSFSHMYDMYCQDQCEIKNQDVEIEKLKKDLDCAKRLNNNEFSDLINEFKKEINFLRACNTDKLDRMVVTSKLIKNLINNNKNYYAEIIRLQKEILDLKEKTKNLIFLKESLDWAFKQEKNKVINLNAEIIELNKLLKEKQSIIDAKKFADFQPIDNSRVGMTTPIKKADENEWKVDF